jgi:energy-coupling factor transport system ATP-binding protein
MGENGAGKTTLVKHFNGLLRPNIGNVLFNGNNVKDSSVAFLSKNIGLVFQNPDDQLFEENVESELAFALKNFGFNENVITQRIEWALNLLNLEEYRRTSPFILSGGERKRVALASVLAWDPSILVLDEPTVGQDYGQKERLRHFLMHLRAQGKTVVIVTHDVEFVAECQPRIVLMSQGKVVADGSAKKIMTSVDSLRKCSVAQPEITRLFRKLHPHGFPKDVLDVNEAFDYLYKRLEALV